MTEKLKKSKLRYNEYYNTQEMFDKLYEQSKSGKNFTKLMELISSEQNIKLAYRKIKRNKGSKTGGVNYHTIKNIENFTTEEVIKYIQARLQNYIPHKIKRVEIPKPNGKTRPLGIPTIEDRLIQQCVLQVLEPICEAKFYNHSYGFRPNRSTHHALARVYSLININKLHYVVDIDIKGFFDNVNHSKLIKQMWSLGIRDKRLICVISKMLKANVKDIGIPKVGTPQGGILSPLLSNIVLNELDWWIANQWETMKTRNEFHNVSNKNRALRNSGLKEMYIVRYADDFKIFCRNIRVAKIMFQAVQKWLKERLDLDISDEKSKITNLKREHTEFLGFKIKAVTKGKKYVVKSKLTDKAKKNCETKLKTCIAEIKSNTTLLAVNKYNATVMGLQNYYAVATQISKDFSKIAFIVRKTLYNQLRYNFGKTGKKTKTYQERYGDSKTKPKYICGIALFPLERVSNKVPMNFVQETCDFTIVGRNLIHRNLQRYNMKIVRYLMMNPIKGQTIEYNDNRISKYISQYGKCAITKEILEIGNMESHHIIPKSKGGTDKFDNLIFIISDVHKLIHATNEETIKSYLNIVKPDNKTLKIINDYREKTGNCLI